MTFGHSRSSGGDLNAIQLATGAVLWTFNAGGWDGSATFGTDGSLVYAGCTNGAMYAFNVETGAVVWIYKTSAAIESKPAVGPDGTVYFTSDSGDVHAVNGATGILQWMSRTLSSLPSSFSAPVLDADTNALYVASQYPGTLFALDPVSGTVLWNLSLGQGHTRSSPLVFNGLLYLASGDANDNPLLHAISLV
jgi:outer membrane protein assembly factor BamB